MSEIYPPEQVDGKWSVEISHYPESRSIEYHSFDSEKEAQEFYDIVTGVKPPKPSYAALRERLEEAERLLRIAHIQGDSISETYRDEIKRFLEEGR